MTGKGLLQRLLAVTGAGLVFLVWSEYVFVNDDPARALASGDLSNLAVMAAVYVTLAWLFLVALGRLRPGDAWGLFLVACLFGWATEALFVPIAYEAPPVSYIWPSVGWHALLDVMLGWVALRWLMRRAALWQVAAVHGLLGAGWALWATWLAAGDGALLTTAEFTRLALSAGALWLAGLWLSDRMTSVPRPGRAETLVAALVALALFAATGLPYWPSALGLAAIAGLTALAASRRPGAPPVPSGPAPAPSRYLAAAAMPLAAAAAYPLILASGLRAPAEDLPALLLFAGGAAWLYALLRGLLPGGPATRA